MDDRPEDGAFKIYFKGVGYEPEKDWSLTFFYNSNIVEPFKDFQNFLRQYNELSRKKRALSFNNIAKVIKHGSIENYNVQNYYVLLRKKKNKNEKSLDNEGPVEEIREGYLLARLKSQEDLILGYWPYEFFYHHLELQHVPVVSINRIIESPEEFENILLIS
ncbi:MAG: hypothetical protein ACTSYF_05820 [Promethearchaeota archaeon]